jgi:AraC-like DNA-binding protein
MPERLYVRLIDDAELGPETNAPAGSLCEAPVTAALRPYVSSVMFYREQLETEVIERVVPDGAVRLAFNFADAPTAGTGRGPRAEAIGAATVPTLVRLRGRMDGVSVTLRAGAAFALLGLPARELLGSATPLDALWSGEASRLLEHMMEARDDRARVRVLERALLERIQSQTRSASERERAARAAELITRGAGRLSVRAAADVVGVGERRLQQLFQQHVGLSPRALGRLSRMHALLRALRRNPKPSWAGLAADVGFYDQAHLANEFRALSGVSPTAFIQRVSGSSKTGG